MKTNKPDQTAFSTHPARNYRIKKRHGLLSTAEINEHLEKIQLTSSKKRSMANRMSAEKTRKNLSNKIEQLKTETQAKAEQLRSFGIFSTPQTSNENQLPVKIELENSRQTAHDDVSTWTQKERIKHINKKSAAAHRLKIKAELDALINTNQLLDEQIAAAAIQEKNHFTVIPNDDLIKPDTDLLDSFIVDYNLFIFENYNQIQSTEHNVVTPDPIPNSSSFSFK